MALNGVLLVALSMWILKPGATAVTAALAAPSPTAAAREPLVLPTLASLPTRASVLSLSGIRFGVTAPQVPWLPAEIAQIAGKAGAHPTMLQFFVKWTESFRPEALVMCYAQGALPVLSWEPWAGARKGTDQPQYALRNIINGTFDPYVTRFATAVRDQPLPVAIRLAHEMNGIWYPWSEGRSGNRPGEYAQAWRHVHDIFRQVGANNVIWIWSPNILRPVPGIGLRQLYPGDEYVDWVGMVGYAAEERTAAEVYEPTMLSLRTFTTKPIVITETGAPSGAYKDKWIADFLHWLPTHPDLVGFIWSEYTQNNGGNADWRLTETPTTVAAFRQGLSSLSLAPAPT
jgi:hypothetical protein